MGNPPVCKPRPGKMQGWRRRNYNPREQRFWSELDDVGVRQFDKAYLHTYSQFWYRLQTFSKSCVAADLGWQGLILVCACWLD